MNDALLSPKQAADYILKEWHLKVSVATVRRWADEGAVQAEIVGGRRFIAPAALHAVLDAPKRETADGRPR